MSPDKLVSTIYFGDRSVKRICIDGWARVVRITIDQISRIRSLDGQWNFYDEEDVTDAELVLSGVKSVRFDPAGPLPNDLIESVLCRARSDGMYELSVRAISILDDGSTVTVEVSIVATDMYLLDPSHPGVEIRE